MRRVARAWWLVGGTAVAVQTTLPPGTLHGLVYVGMAVGALALTAVGLRHHRPAHRTGWYVLLAGLAAWTCGDVVWALLGPIVGSGAFPAGSHPFYLLGYGLFVASLALGAREGSGRLTAESVVDGLITGVVVMLIFLAVFVEPAWAVAGGPSPTLVIDLAYLLADVVIVVMVGHLARAHAARRPALRLVGLAFVALLVGDVMHNVAARVPEVAASPHLVDTWWLLWYLLLGAAALHPSAAGAARTEPEPAHRPLSGVHVALLGLALVLVPAVPITQRLIGRPLSFASSLTAAVVVIALVCVRLLLVARRMRAQAELLTEMAETDARTGLPNETRFATALRARLRDAPDRPVVVAIVALDRFTEITDTLGYRVGDELLRAAARRLRGVVGDTGTAARLGGEAFAVLVELADDDDVLDWASRVRAELVAPFTLSDVEVSVDALVGVAVAPDDGTDPEELREHADVALSAARGRSDRVARYTGRMAADGRTPHLMAELAAALVTGEIVVHYQPQVELATGRVEGVEALVRWQHPVHGLLPPAAFVPAAERTGLVRPLTLHVLGVALAQAARWRDEGRALAVSVNLSVRDLLDPDFARRVAEVLALHGLDHRSLELEVTETMAMVDPERSLDVLEALAGLGVVLSIDDFGTGYSSLAQLQRLPVRRLKIDRSFVGGMVATEASAVIVRSTIELARNLGMTVVAEGVEDDATLVSLREMGCDAAQGFGLGRPVPAELVTGLVEAIEVGVPRVLLQAEPVGTGPGHGSAGA